MDGTTASTERISASGVLPALGARLRSGRAA
jgi:hypothetical protein